jgi:hypothetical protein
MAPISPIADDFTAYLSDYAKRLSSGKYNPNSRTFDESLPIQGEATMGWPFLSSLLTSLFTLPTTLKPALSMSTKNLQTKRVIASLWRHE